MFQHLLSFWITHHFLCVKYEENFPNMLRDGWRKFKAAGLIQCIKHLKKLYASMFDCRTTSTCWQDLVDTIYEANKPYSAMDFRQWYVGASSRWLFFSDEAHFQLDGHVTKQNCRTNIQERSISNPCIHLGWLWRVDFGLAQSLARIS